MSAQTEGATVAERREAEAEGGRRELSQHDLDPELCWAIDPDCARCRAGKAGA